MTPGTEERAGAIQKRANAATPPPWHLHFGKHPQHPELGGAQGVAFLTVSADPAEPAGLIMRPVHYADRRHADSDVNAEFIAHAREDIPWLLSELAVRDAALRDMAEELALRRGYGEVKRDDVLSEFLARAREGKEQT